MSTGGLTLPILWVRWTIDSVIQGAVETSTQRLMSSLEWEIGRSVAASGMTKGTRRRNMPSERHFAGASIVAMADRGIRANLPFHRALRPRGCAIAAGGQVSPPEPATPTMSADAQATSRIAAPDSVFASSGLRLLFGSDAGKGEPTMNQTYTAVIKHDADS